MKRRTTTIMSRLLVCGLMLLTAGTAYAKTKLEYKKGDVVDLTTTLKGRVTEDAKESRSAVPVEVYQNKDNKPKGALKIEYIYAIDGVDFVVERIAASGFSSNSDITSVSHPNVESIGSAAFYGCQNLKTCDLSKVQSIGDQAFMYSGLTQAILTNIWNIGKQAFAWCKSLTKVEVGNECRIISGMAFGIDESLKEAILHYGLTEIGVNNFTNSLALADFVLPYTVTTIQNDLTDNSTLNRLFILSPSFKDYCYPEEEGKLPVGYNLIEHSTLKEIYVLDDVLDDVNNMLTAAQGQPNIPAITAKPISDLVEVVPVFGKEGQFKIIKHDEDINFVEVYKSNNRDRVYDNDNKEGIFTVSDGKAIINIIDDKLPPLRYQVTIDNSLHPVTPEQVVKLYGDIFTGKWDNAEMTKTEGLWVKKDVTVKTGNFLVQIFENAASTTPIYVKSPDSGGKIVLGTPSIGTTDGNNWSINKGTYTFTFNPATYELTVTGTEDTTPDPDPVWSYTLHGDIENGTEWKDIKLTETDGIWSATVTDIAGGQFGIKSYDTANEKEGPWIAAPKGEKEGAIEVVFDKAMPTADSNTANWIIGEGNYTISYNPTAKTLLVTDNSPKDYYLTGVFNDWATSETDKFTEGENGEYTFEIDELKGDFRISGGKTADEKIYGSNGTEIELEKAYICSSEKDVAALSFPAPVLKAKLTFVPATNTLTVTGEMKHDYYYVIYGKPTADGEWKDYPLTLDEEQEWTASFENVPVEFYIKEYDKEISTETVSSIIKSNSEGTMDQTGQYPTIKNAGVNWISTLPQNMTLSFNPQKRYIRVSKTTGVNLIETDEHEAIYYNLQGQRIANPEKGIYIRVVNGVAKKVAR
ncbi:MAG: leucine-rich repeat domain-containing protein [Muribaculaceae bacterium]|nr:leucine-rich repeat domain-containing protein [Muribaculaceae bacterium]